MLKNGELEQDFNKIKEPMSATLSVPRDFTYLTDLMSVMEPDEQKNKLTGYDVSNIITLNKRYIK